MTHFLVFPSPLSTQIQCFWLHFNMGMKRSKMLVLQLGPQIGWVICSLSLENVCDVGNT